MQDAFKDSWAAHSTSRHLPLRRSTMFIAGSVTRVFSSGGAASAVGRPAAPPELMGLSCTAIYKHGAPPELINLCGNQWLLLFVPHRVAKIRNRTWRQAE